MKKLNIVYMGTPMFSVGPLKELIKEHNVSLVVTQPDKKVGRKQERSLSVNHFLILYLHRIKERTS